MQNKYSHRRPMSRGERRTATLPRRVQHVCRILLQSLLSFGVPHQAPVGMFRTECLDRHFSLVVKSSFLGSTFRFDIEGDSGVHPVSGRRAAQCGYTVLLNPAGDLVLRASYLACDVDSQDVTGPQLLVWFMNTEADDSESTYPFLLTCPLPHWSPREIVCEENYMECVVSSSHQGSEEGGTKEWRVVFSVPAKPSSSLSAMKEETLSLKEAQLMGYHVNATGTRIILRCAYSAPHAYVMQEKGVILEVISATVFYRHQWTLLMVDTSLACNMHKGELDGSYILWRSPQLLPPLVQVPYEEKGAAVGVAGSFLSDCKLQQRGYRLSIEDGVVVIGIPFGADGGFLKSHVMHGKYSQSYSIDLFYMHQWRDAQWDLTQHRSFRHLWTPAVPRTPSIMNLTVPAEGVFSVSLGAFPPDVSLTHLTVGGHVVPIPDAEKFGLLVSHVPLPNGSHSYLLQVPFSHHLVAQKYLGNRFRRYTLQVNFTLLLVPHGETFSHPASVVCELQDVVFPKIKAQCTDASIRLQLHYGNMEAQWWLYIGGHRLEPELVDKGGYWLENGPGYLGVEVPLFGPGMAYEDLSLQGLVANLVISLVDVDTGTAEHSFIQRCTFPLRELMVCLPDGRMVVLVDTAGALPPVDPRHTSLLDPSCKPQDSDHSRALFSFRLNSCGTTVSVEENNLVFINEVRYSPKGQPAPNQFTHPSYRYRRPIGCRYPINGTQEMLIYKSRAAAKIPPLTRPRRSLKGQSRWLSFIRGNVSCTPWCGLWR
ncbi:uncharacterized protein LOC125724912 [Brienomyrus brachyistius]|uniref:uncharacterized protein LOC125724912 n=1 Tax=Brienomyrus brachyistius TaxID=42636 RepID=UPI0020B4072C|nr:uncharacterized protein LOC125724912 [Brienomyrus brachyistius]